MHPFRRALALLALAAFWPAASLALPDPSPDPGASVVFLRTDCDVQGVSKENCFESMAALSDPATGWIWNTRTPSPSASSPLLVDIGPGEFGTFECDGGGYVTLRGAGREQTILKGGESGVEIKNCDDLGFLHLGVHGERVSVNWVGSGFSSWSDVDIVMTGESTQTTGAWSDICDYPNLERSLHYFHGSRVRTTGRGEALTSAFYSTCAENWFFGGEILVDLDGYTREVNAIRVPQARGDVRIFGTTVRTRIQAAGDVQNRHAGVFVTHGGTFHSHGSIVNVSAQGAPGDRDVVALQVDGSGSFAHTPGTTFVVTPGGNGSGTRVETLNGGVAKSPFLWQPSDVPPAVASEHGSDLYVETDCDATGCTGGADPHLMIYSDSCTGAGGPWFDVVRQTCRN